MIYLVEIWVYGKGYIKALAIGKRRALAKEVELLSRHSWYDIKAYDVRITRVV